MAEPVDDSPPCGETPQCDLFAVGFNQPLVVVEAAGEVFAVVQLLNDPGTERVYPAIAAHARCSATASRRMDENESAVLPVFEQR